MKMVVAFIRPERLSDVALALEELPGLTGVSVSDIRGFGRGRGNTADSRNQQVFDFLPKIRLEIACSSELVDQIVGVIERDSRTGLRGDGKIIVMNVEEAVRISTGERGEAAI